CTTHNGGGVVYARHWKGTKASRRAAPKTDEIATTMAVSGTEHCRGHRAVARSDRRSRTPISGRRFHRPFSHRAFSAVSWFLNLLATARKALDSRTFSDTP